MEGETVGGLVPGGGSELEFPGVGCAHNPGNDKLTGSEGALVGSRVSGPVEETGEVDDSPVGIAKVEEDGGVGKNSFGGRPVGILHHPAPEEGAGCEGEVGGEIIAQGRLARGIEEGEGAEPGTEIERIPEEEGGSGGAVPVEEGCRFLPPEAEAGFAGGGQQEEGEVVGIEQVAPEGEVGRGQVADPDRVDEVEARSAVGDGRHREPAIAPRRVGGLEDPAHRSVVSARPPEVGVGGGREVDEEAASVGVGSVVLHEHGVGSSARAGEVIPDGPSGIVVSITGAGTACDFHPRGHRVEGQSIVEGFLPHLACRSVEPGDQSLGEADEIGGRVGGVVMVELDREASEFLFLQRDLKVSQDLGRGAGREGEKQQGQGEAGHRVKIV